MHGGSLGPRPKTNPSVDRFQFSRALYWKRYTHRMRSGDETSMGLGTRLHITYRCRRCSQAVVFLLPQGLKHLHDNRLCHFDIKPANIFIGRDGTTCKLGDFGLCVSLDERLNEAVEGDAVYMAPELMQGNFGKPADVFRSVILSVKNCRFVTLPFLSCD